MLTDITFWEWPDPAFDKMYRRVDEALSQAIELHEETHKFGLSSMSWQKKEIYETVRSLLRHKGTKQKTLYLVVNLSFEEVDGDPIADHPETPYLMRLTYEDGKLSATCA